MQEKGLQMLHESGGHLAAGRQHSSTPGLGWAGLGWAGLGWGPLLEMSHWVIFITAAITHNCSIRIKLSWTKWTVKLVSQTKNK